MVENVNTTSICCPRLIKRQKTSGKREKIACATMGHLPKLKKTKMEV